MGNGMNPHVIQCAPKTHYMIATCLVSHFLFLISYFHFLFPIPHSWFYTTRTNDTLSCARCRNIGFKPLTTQLTAKGRAARGRLRAAIWALRLLARENSYARTSNVRGQAERLAVIDRFSLCFFLSTMADGSAGPDGMSSSPSVTDLKDLIKDSLRELLQDEPALFSQASRGVTGGVDGESHGGEFCRICHWNCVLFVRRGRRAPIGGAGCGIRPPPPWRPWKATRRGWTAGWACWAYWWPR